MSSAKALTARDWERIGRASASDGDRQAFRDEVEAVVRARLAKAWDQGFDRGWTLGVRDATEDDGGGHLTRPDNPYRTT